MDFRLDFEPLGDPQKRPHKSEEFERILVMIIVKDFNPHDNPQTKILTENALQYVALRND